MILTEINGTKPYDYTFHKKNQVVTLGLKSSSVNIGGDRLQIDPLLLFQRLTTVMQSSDDLELAFKHELCSYPPALFDSSLLLNEADKPALADVMCKWLKVVSMVWKWCLKWCLWVKVVWYYENMSTSLKMWCITGGQRERPSATVIVLANMTTTMKKEQFLTNKKNKFIFMLSAELEKRSCKTYHTPADADFLIVQKAVQSTTTSTTVLGGHDTDLIILLCYHASLDSHDIFFCPEPRKNTKSFATGILEPP